MTLIHIHVDVLSVTFRHKFGINTNLIKHDNNKTIMGRIDVVIPDDTEKKIRMKAVELYGGKKGSLSDVITQALEDWINLEASKRTRKK